MISIKNLDQMRSMAATGCLMYAAIRHTVSWLTQELQAGTEVSTADIETLYKNIINSIAGPKYIYPFETINDYGHAVCLSVNEYAVHQRPSPDVILKPPFILKIDAGLAGPDPVNKNKHLCVDAATVYFYAETAPQIGTLYRQLLSRDRDLETIRHMKREITNFCNESSLLARSQLAYARAGMSLARLSAAGLQFAEHKHIHLLKDIAGHGIGHNLHEDPLIFSSPLQYPGATGAKALLPGMTFCLEPIVASKDPGSLIVDPDGFGAKTSEGAWTIHHEICVGINPESGFAENICDLGGPWGYLEEGE